MIDSYRFGKIIIKGTAYSSDVIIYPEKVDASWWRKDGHNLCLNDIKDILNVKPETLIIGQGNPGLMKVSNRIQSTIKNMGIELFVSGTEKAVKKYNEIYKKKKTVAALHLTC